MADVYVGTANTSADDFVPQLWTPFVLEVLRKNVVLADLVWRRFEKELKLGDTLNVPTPATTTVSTVTFPGDIGTITFDSPNEDVTQILVNKFAYQAHRIQSPAIKESIVDLVEYYSGEIGKGLAVQLDSDIGASLEGTTQVVGTDNVAVIDDNIRRARQYLDDGNINPNQRYGVVSPATLMDLWNIELYRNSLYNVLGKLDTTKGRGFVGTIYGFDFYESTSLPAGTSGKKNLMFQREANALVVQEEPVIEFRHPHDVFATVVRAYILYGNKLMRNAAAVEVDGR